MPGGPRLTPWRPPDELRKLYGQCILCRHLAPFDELTLVPLNADTLARLHREPCPGPRL